MNFASRRPDARAERGSPAQRRRAGKGTTTPVSVGRATSAVAVSAAKGGTAALAVGLLLATYILPAYADSNRGAPLSLTRATGTQNVHVRSGVDQTSRALARDTYTVTKQGPVVSSRFSQSPRSYNFANNPNNLIIQWPFDHGVPIVSDFGPRASPCRGCSSFHEGLDMAGGLDTPIQIIADGVVSKLGNPEGSYGVYAIIDHVIDGQRVSSLYGHMILGSLSVAVGDRVKKGQIVGRVGSTGASSGPHLHLGIYLDGTVAVDPWAWMKQKVGS